MMKTWIVEPRDTAVLRDGRPATDGAPMRTLPFPWPSSIAGLVRTEAGRGPDGRFTGRPDELLAIEVAGPWLVELAPTGEPVESLVPAPADALFMESGGTKRRFRLAPRPLRPGDITDLKDLELVQPLAELPEGKPPRAPAFWRWSEVRSWLEAPADSDAPDMEALGLDSIPVETRVHVAIDGDRQTAAEAQLFSTQGLRLAAESGARNRRRYAFAFGCDDPRLRSKLVHLGGERRISSLRAAPGAALNAPELAGVVSRVRVLLLTPGPFSNGFRPSDARLHELGARLVAAAVGRPTWISGWDFKANGPKKSRRMAPAGSVYWLEIDNPALWARTYQFGSLCDDPQDRRDGFGRFVVGVP